MYGKNAAAPEAVHADHGLHRCAEPTHSERYVNGQYIARTKHFRDLSVHRFCSVAPQSATQKTAHCRFGLSRNTPPTELKQQRPISGRRHNFVNQ
jgi:hypothetical protein